MSDAASLLAAHAGPPGWWARTADPALAPAASPLPARIGTAIIGGGVAGASMAFELVGRGAAPGSIAILEARQAAFGASGRNGGFVLSFPGVELLDWVRLRGREGALELMRLNIENRRLVSEFVGERGLWAQRGGSWSLAVGEEESDRLRDCLDLLEEAAPGAFEFAPKAPAPVEGFAAGIRQREDFGIQPADYTAALAKASGARFVPGCVVEPGGILVRDGGVDLETSLGPVRADRVVLAANAWVPVFFPALDPGPLRPVRNHVIVAQVEEDAPDWGDAIWYADHGYLYFRALPGGRFLLGGARNLDPEPEETLDAGSNPRIAGGLKRQILPWVLAGSPTRILAEWTGPMAFSPDGAPLAGLAPGTQDRVAILAGFSGYGLGFHRVAARAAASALAGEGDGGPFHPGRFGGAVSRG